MTDAKRITEAVVKTLRNGGDNLAIYEAVSEALTASPLRVLVIEECAKIAEGPLMPGCNGRFRGREGANWEAKPMRHTYAAGRLEAAAEIRASSASLSEQHEETK